MTVEPPAVERPTRLLTPEFWILAASASVYFLGIGSLNVLVPTYVVDELGGSEATSGFVMGSMAITAVVTRPWFGRMADRRGARDIIAIGAMVTCLAILVLAVDSSLLGAFASRLLLGAGGAGTFTGAIMLSMEIAPEHRRGEAGAYILIAFHAGLGIGPIGAEPLLDATSYRTVWLVVAALAAVSLLIALALPNRHRIPDGLAPGPLIHRAAILPGLVTLFGVCAFNGLLQFAPLYAREIGLDDVGIVFTIASLTIVVVRLAFGRVPDMIGPVRAGSGALVLTAFAAAVVAFWAEPIGLYLGAGLLACGLSLQSPSFMTLAIEGVEERERGSALATYTGFFDVANAIVGPAVGLIVVGFDYRVAFLTAGSMSLVALAILRLVVAPRRTARFAAVG